MSCGCGQAAGLVTVTGVRLVVVDVEDGLLGILDMRWRNLEGNIEKLQRAIPTPCNKLIPIYTQLLHRVKEYLLVGLVPCYIVNAVFGVKPNWVSYSACIVSCDEVSAEE